MKIITKSYLLILVLLLPYWNTYAEENVPPTYWENYMSFKIGNYFEYEVNNGLLRYTRRIIGDTVVQSNGHHYYKIEYRYPLNSNPQYLFERIDSTGTWFQYSGTQEDCIRYKLNVPLHTQYLFGCGVNNMEFLDTSQNTVLGNTVKIFVYHLYGLAQTDTYIAQKFQMSYRYNYEGGNRENLVGAIIDSVVYGSVSGISITNTEIPSEYKLYQNYPNPFNPKTLIKFSVPERSYIRLVIIDAIGREVEILYDGYANLDEYQVEFDGSGLSSGVYFCKLQSSNYSKTIKMLLMK